MVRYRRNLVPGGTFFFTIALQDRRTALLTDHINALRDAFRVTRSRHPFSVDAIVVLPDHLHVVMTLPDGDSDFSGRWRSIKGLFTRCIVEDGFSARRNGRGEYNVWQRRFWEHTIRDESDFARHVDYIHYNPVKHGLVGAVDQWPHSSFHLYVRNGLLPRDWGGSIIHESFAFGEPK